MSAISACRRAAIAAARVRAAPVFVRCMSSNPYGVYDPREDESYEPPARDRVVMQFFADFRSDTGEA